MFLQSLMLNGLITANSMKKFLTTLLTVSVLIPSLSSASDIAGFCKLSGDDTLAWDASGRFADIDFQQAVPFKGAVLSLTADTLSLKGAFFTLNEFVFEAGVQPSQYYVEIDSGTAAGQRFNITANTGNVLTVDLDGGSLSGIAADDEVRIVAHWTLDTLFPTGRGITASTASTSGSEISLPTADGGNVDFSTAPTFEYRSDLGHWINTNDAATDAGETVIPHGATVVVRQDSATPLTPILKGIESLSGPTLQITVNYYETGLDSFANALSITGSGTEGVDTRLATGEASEPQHGGNATTASAWLKYSSAQSGTLTVNSQYSSFNTILAAYTGSSVAALTPVVSNDDVVGGANWSEIEVPITAGVDTYIAIDGSAGATGTGYLTWTFVEGANVDAPTNLLINPGGSGVTLSWNAAAGATTYTIYRSGDGTFGNAVAIGNTATNSFLDSTMADGVTYTYWVEAGNGSSTEVSANSLLARTKSPATPLANISASAIETSSDFDENGIDDLILQNRNSGEIAWWHLEDSGDGTIAGGEVLSINAGPEWQLVNHSDFNEDGTPDLLLRNRDSGQVIVWALDGTELNVENSGALQPGDSAFTAAQAWQVAGVDQMEMATQNAETGQIAHWQIKADADDSSAYQIEGGGLFNTQPTKIDWQLVGMRDFNGDGNSDLFFQNQEDGKMAVWYLDESRNLQGAAALSAQTNDTDWQVRGFGDWNGDGNTDIAIQHADTGAIALWNLNGVNVLSQHDLSAQSGADWQLSNSTRGE